MIKTFRKTFSVLARYIMYFHVCNNNTKTLSCLRLHLVSRNHTTRCRVLGKKEGGCYNQSHLSVNNVQKEAFPQKKYRTKTYFNLIYSRPIEMFCVVQISFMQIRTFYIKYVLRLAVQIFNKMFQVGFKIYTFLIE